MSFKVLHESISHHIKYSETFFDCFGAFLSFSTFYSKPANSFLLLHGVYLDLWCFAVQYCVLVETQPSFETLFLFENLGYILISYVGNTFKYTVMASCAIEREYEYANAKY